MKKGAAKKKKDAHKPKHVCAHLLKMSAKLREFACLSFSSMPNARRMYKPCHDCSSISTKSGFEQLTYIHCTTICQNYSFYKKIDPPNGIQNYSARSQISSRQTPQSCSLQAKMPFQSKVGPQNHSSLPHSPFDLYFIDFHFLYIFFSLHLLFSIPFQDLAFPSFLTCCYCFRSLVPLLSLWFGSVKNRRRFGLQATTGMCHSCIVSACEHTNIIGHGDDILLMAF